TLHPASTTNPRTWGTFDACWAALASALEEWEIEDPGAYRGGGLGFVFSRQDPYAGIDLDGCVDVVTGAVAAWAQTIVDSLASYTEITPTTTGLHVLVEASMLPQARNKQDPIELYDYGRFFTMTGWH